MGTSGDRIGNHSVDHPSFEHLTDAQVRAELLDAAATIRAVTGVDPAPLFRFPYGAYDDRTGNHPVEHRVAGPGWTPARGDRAHARRVEPDRRLDGSTLDAEALPAVISAVRAAGYSFVALSALDGG
ncbi:MAG TPA: polysaccharide deacetylase family protein [Acidimicrobiales bacterium]|nr:polysaccharide deacetylase family protein [Acidimicrobiales bacterium]